MRHDKIARTDFREQTVNCPECGGSGVRMGATYNDIECFDCGGGGQWPASCAYCLGEHELNDAGLCSDCSLLTECRGDPLFRGFGDGE